MSSSIQFNSKKPTKTYGRRGKTRQEPVSDAAPRNRVARSTSVVGDDDGDEDRDDGKTLSPRKVGDTGVVRGRSRSRYGDGEGGIDDGIMVVIPERSRSRGHSRKPSSGIGVGGEGRAGRIADGEGEMTGVEVGKDKKPSSTSSARSQSSPKQRRPRSHSIIEVAIPPRTRFRPSRQTSARDEGGGGGIAKAVPGPASRLLLRGEREDSIASNASTTSNADVAALLTPLLVASKGVGSVVASNGNGRGRLGEKTDIGADCLEKGSPRKRESATQGAKAAGKRVEVAGQVKTKKDKESDQQQSGVGDTTGPGSKAPDETGPASPSMSRPRRSASISPPVSRTKRPGKRTLIPDAGDAGNMDPSPSRAKKPRTRDVVDGDEDDGDPAIIVRPPDSRKRSQSVVDAAPTKSRQAATETNGKKGPSSARPDSPPALQVVIPFLESPRRKGQKRKAAVLGDDTTSTVQPAAEGAKAKEKEGKGPSASSPKVQKLSRQSTPSPSKSQGPSTPARDLSGIFEILDEASPNRSPVGSRPDTPPGSGKRTSGLVSRMSARSSRSDIPGEDVEGSPSRSSLNGSSSLGDRLAAEGSPSKRPPVRSSTFPSVSRETADTFLSPSDSQRQIWSTASLPAGLDILPPQSPSPSRSLSRAPSLVQQHLSPSTDGRPLSRSATWVDSGITGPVAGPSKPQNLTMAKGVQPAAKRTYGATRSFLADVDEQLLLPQPPPDTDEESTTLLSSRLPPGSFLNGHLEAKQGGLTGATPRRSFGVGVGLLKVRESYSEMRKKWGIDIDDELDAAANSQESQPNLKSIVELRLAGENRKFSDEMGYLLDGLEEKHPLGIKRTSAIEIMRKCSSPDFVRKLKTSGYIAKVYQKLRDVGAGNGDRILDVALAFYIATLTSEQRHAEPMLRISADLASESSGRCECMDVLAAMLDRPWSGDTLGEGKSAKLEKRMLTTQLDIISAHDLFSHDQKISLRCLALKSISAIASFTARLNFQPALLISSSGSLRFVSRTLLEEIAVFDERLSGYETGLNLLPPQGGPDLGIVEACLRILEACTSSVDESHTLLASDIKALGASLPPLMLACHVVACEGDMTLASSAMDSLISSLRLLINLTNTGVHWCQILLDSSVMVPTLARLILRTQRTSSSVTQLSRGRPSTIPTSSPQPLSSPASPPSSSIAVIKFDLLCLSLGLLTNLVETAEQGRNVVRETELGIDCPGGRTCIRKCRCPKRSSFIECLANLYLDQVAAAAELQAQPLQDLEQVTADADADFVRGYMGILLGLIMLDSPTNQAIIVDALRGKGTSLSTLLDTMSSFAALHEQVERKASAAVALMSGEQEAAEDTDVGASVSVDARMVSEDVGKTARAIREMVESLNT